MENFSTTQGANIAIIASAIVILITKINDLTSLTAEDITTIIAAVVAIVASVKSFINRFKKGDITVVGFYNGKMARE